MDTTKRHVGNFAIMVNAYDGDTLVINTPTFIMGGVFGQAMTKNDIVANLKHFWPNIVDSTVAINGESVSNGTNDTTYYVNIHPTDY